MGIRWQKLSNSILVHNALFKEVIEEWTQKWKHLTNQRESLKSSELPLAFDRQLGMEGGVL